MIGLRYLCEEVHAHRPACAVCACESGTDAEPETERREGGGEAAMAGEPTVALATAVSAAAEEAVLEAAEAAPISTANCRLRLLSLDFR